VLFKKGYFGRKRTPPNPSPTETQEVHSGDSVENEPYMTEEPQYAYPAPAGYVDPTGVYYVNGNTFEAYDPYTGTVTVVVGPPAQYPGATPVLAALPCQPVPLQPVEWFNPAAAAAAAPWCYSYNRRKRYSTDSQNCSAQSSESTGPPGSPQEPVDEAAAAAMYPPPPGPHYVYPGYMFGPPIYNMNGMTVQGVMPQPVPVAPDLTANKRRKKRRRRRRGGVTDDGSESSCCEEPLTCDVTGCQSETSQSGASSDAGVGPNSDSGINTNSGSNSPPLEHPHQHQHLYTSLCATATPDAEVEVSEELSTADDDVTPNLCVAAPEFSSQESTLSCLSTPSAVKDPSPKEEEICNDVAQEEEPGNCHSIESLQEITVRDDVEDDVDVTPCLEDDGELLPRLDEPLPESASEDLIENPEEKMRDIKEVLCELKNIPLTLEAVCCEKDVEIELRTTGESQDTVTNSVYEECDSTCDELPEEDVVAQKTETEVLENLAQKKDLNGDIKEETESDELAIDEENIKDIVVSFIFQQEKAIRNDDQKLQQVQNIQLKDDLNDKETTIEVEMGKDFNKPTCSTNTPSSVSTSTLQCDDSLQRLSIDGNSLTPVPPPRRKKSLSRAAERTATRVVEEAIKEGLEEAARVRLKSPLSITEAVTRWLNSHESSPLTCVASDEESENDEGIEVEEEESTGQKNVRGNPFPASSHSDAGQRVANDCESLSSAGEWDLWDGSHSHTREMCDPARSVDKYYRLGADEGVPSVYKTAMHIRHTGPFPCGVCCIIQ